MTIVHADPLPVRDLSRALKRATNYRTAVLVGIASVILLVTVFGALSFAVTFSGATMAMGEFVARGQNRLVQHLEGGIITEIAVEEGQKVKAGDVLVRLDTTRVEAELASLKSQFDVLAAREARLLAERDGLDEIVYPQALLDRAAQDPQIATYMADQTKEFSAARERRLTEVAIFEHKILAKRAEIAGYESQRVAGKDQQALLTEEIASLQGLFDQGLVDQQRLLDAKRKQLELASEDGRLLSGIESSRQTILENEKQIQKLTDEVVAVAASDVVDLRVEMTKVVNDTIAQTDILNRSIIRSPVDGVIVELQFNTIGAVVAQGDSVAEILPQPADLLVEARIRPDDIDRVFAGQDAAIRIPALHIPYASLIPAKIEYVSADSFVDKDTGEVYYTSRISAIELPPDIDRDRLAPGMAVETFLISQPRTFAEYLIGPLWEGLTRSLREE